MAALLGVETTILSASKDDGVAHVEADNGSWLWLMEWLTPVPVESHKR